MYKTKRWAAILLAMFLAIALVMMPDLRVSADQDIFDIDVESELDTTGLYYLVSLNIKNNSSDFTGCARVIIETSSSSSNISYDVDISLPANGEKTYSVTIPVENTGASQIVEVEILNTKDKSVYKEKFRNALSIYMSTIKLGLLADNSDELDFLDLGGGSVNVNGQDYKVVTSNLDGSDLADTENLSGFDIIVINDFDTSSLSEEAVNNLKNWVKSGGNLILGTGENYKKVMAQDWGINVLEGDISLYTDYNMIDTETETEVSMAQVNADDFYMDFNYCSQYSYYKVDSSGTYTLYLIDLGDLYDAQGGYGDFVKNEMSTVYSQVLSSSSKFSYSGSNNNLEIYNISDIEAYMEKPAQTGGGLMVFLIIIYVVLVGPIIYLILKAMKKQEIIWLAIPGLSLLFVVFIILISLGVRVKGLTVKSVTVQNLDSGLADTYIMGYSPNPKSWSLEMDSSYESATLYTDYDYSDNDKLWGSVKKDDHLNVTYNPNGTFELACIDVKSNPGTQPGFDINYTFDFDDTDEYDQDDDEYDDYTSYNGTNVVGTVENNTGMDFDFVLIFDDTGMMLEEDVQNGEEINIDFNSSGYSYNGGYYSSYDNILDFYARKYYDKKDYEESGAIASLAMAYYTMSSNTTGIRVIGVKKASGITNENEQSWVCYYNCK
ncbi:MAG: hypothetical protein K6E10_02455 [Eubacterium sp.]|nr:hypothetical protein [Eubacterium sp.]